MTRRKVIRWFRKFLYWLFPAVSLAFVSSVSLADEVIIPYGVYMDEFKSDCKARGLDLENTRTSHGFVDDRAGSFTVFTYETLTPNELDLIKDMSVKHRRA